MSEIVDEWLEQYDELERDGDDVINKHGNLMLSLTGDEKVRIYRSGGLAAQGRVQEVEPDDTFGAFLIIEGERYFERKSWEGKFAAYFAQGTIHIDGPLPEDDDQ